ncbi:hypothetical protein PWY87_34070 [Kribbella solani]|uniref:hypothetical protein n=1 Tax=Kribbella solani TaxID=236067 RepID=UPI0029A7CCF1|nr:hypothetical protein [Kribbella solani]MDX3006744.1 hypothetical protein [Kribbella solani]
MITDNLATLFDTGQPGVRFRQGTILSWNAQTGENTVDLAGGTLTNVPIINTGEAIALRAGHVVGMLGQGSTWFIIGRVTPPNDPNFAAASVAFGSAGAQVFGFALSTAMVLKASSNELVVPDWADEAVVFVGGQTQAVNTTAAKDSYAFRVGCSAGNGGGTFQTVTAGDIGHIGAVSRNRFTGLSGGEVLQITGEAQSLGAAWPLHASNSMFIHAIAIYKSNI